MGNIVFVGTGGTGVSALVRLFIELGYTNLVGIDMSQSELTEQLATEGMQIIIGHGIYQVQVEDIVIYSQATHQSPEVLQSQSYLGTNPKRVRPPMLYFEFLGELSKHFTTLAVAGTHGKSSTTGLLGVTLAQHHPNLGLSIVGAGVTDWDSKNMRCNPRHKDDIKTIVDSIIDPKAPTSTHLLKKYLFTIEADEYNKHLLYLDPDYSIITSLELDHSDIFPTEEEYFATFEQFIHNTRYQVYAPHNEHFQRLYGQHPKVTLVDNQHFDFQHLVGGHNHMNASLAMALAKALGTDNKKSFEQNRGLRRRCETLGTNNNGAVIISDYAHHPTELASTYTALQEKYPDKQILAIFQPHQVRRVLEFWEQFVEVLSGWEHCLIYDIYAAREDLENLKAQFANEATQHISSVDELGDIFADTCDQTYSTDFALVQDIVTQASSDQMVVIFTAGGLDYDLRKFLG